MLSQCHEMLAHQRASPRWKEWIPLVSQQLRLRNLIQVIAYNVNINEKPKCDTKVMKTSKGKMKSAFYYTLHLTTMSAPFYTSEKVESENPKWAEIEICDAVNSVNASVNGIVIRLWVHHKTEQDQMLTVWGVYFSGLIYLGPKLCSDPAAFCLNTIVFHMHGGYFTAPDCFKESTFRQRCSKVQINAADVRPSYTVNLVSRLHTIQQAIKKQMAAAQILREKIAVGGYTTSEFRESATLRRLLNKSRPQAPQRQELLKVQREIEMTKFRVEMLAQERSRKISELQSLERYRNMLYEINQNRGSDLLNSYQMLHREIERLKEKRKTFLEIREAFLLTNGLLTFRQRQLISKMNEIYPVSQVNGKYSICGVYLPNSEDFVGTDEITISVSLGYVAHVTQMISIFLQVPLRYPIIHFGSWSKIVDHVVEKIPEKDREFPLFSRGKDKLQFHYGVYLLNKNVSQLRWYCGLPTQDLRATLPNLSGIIHSQSSCHGSENHQRTSSGSSMDLLNSSQNQSPIGSVPTELENHSYESKGTTTFEKGHRISRSMGSSEIKFQTKVADNDVHFDKDFAVLNGRKRINYSFRATTNLSYSLDKGLDEYEEIQKAGNIMKEPIILKKQVPGRPLGHVGSEPILTLEMREKIPGCDDLDIVSSGDEAKKHFLQSWQARGPAPMCSDEDTEIISKPQQEVDVVECTVPETVEMPSGVSDSNCSMTGSLENVQLEPEYLNEKEERPDVEQDSQTALNIDEENDYPACRFHSLSDAEIINKENRKEMIGSLSSNENIHVSLPNIASLKSGKSASDCVCGVKMEDRNDVFDDNVSLEEINNLLGNSILVDSVFASVASRTEALANRSGSFNLVRSRHSSILEDGHT